MSMKAKGYWIAKRGHTYHVLWTENLTYCGRLTVNVWWNPSRNGVKLANPPSDMPLCKVCNAAIQRMLREASENTERGQDDESDR